VHEDENLCQPLCGEVITPVIEKCKSHESSNNQCFDIFDEDCIYLEELFEEIVELHTNGFENADCDIGCLDDKFVFDEESCKDELNDFCKKRIVEEHHSQLSSEISPELGLAQNPIEEEECLSHDTQNSSEDEIVSSSEEGDNGEIIDEDIVEQSDWDEDEEICDKEWVEEETLVQSGLTIGDKDPNDHIQWRSNVLFDDPEIFEWGDPYPKLAGDGFNPLFQPMEKEPAGLELWLNSLDNISNLNIPDTHIYNDPFYNKSGHFEQGEWIFIHECKSYKNLDPCSDQMDKDECDGCGLSVKLEISNGAIEHEKIVRTPFERKPLDLSLFTFEELIIDQSFDDNVNINKFEKEEKPCCEEWNEIICENLFEDNSEEEGTPKKRENRRRRMRRRKTKMERGLSKMTRRLISTKSPLKRTHWNDGKRARGRSKPSLI